MTVSSETTRVQYNGDGTTAEFSVPFKFLEDDHVKVILTDSAGTDTEWTLGTQYTLTGAGDDAGGTLTVVTSPDDYTPQAGETLTILRDAPLTQETDLPAGGPFPSSSVERSLDLAAMRDQQLDERIDRALRFPESDSDSLDATLPRASERAGNYLTFDANGNPTVNDGTDDARLPASLTALNYLRVNSGASAYEQRTPAQVRGDIGFDDGGFLTLDHTHTYASSTSTTVSGDVTEDYKPGRRVRAVGSATGTIYGEVSSSSHSGGTTTVNYTWDSGSLSNESLTVSVGQASPTGRPIDGDAVNFLQAGTGAVARSAQDRLREVVSVKDFGAAGDGATDDTSAIQAAMDALPSSGGAIYFPAGTYVVSDQFTLTDKPVALVGDGMFVSILKWTSAATGDGFLITQTDDAYTVSVRGLTLLTEKAAVGTALKIDMSGQQVTGTVQDRTQPRVVIRDVAVEGAMGPATDGFSVGLHLVDVIHPVIDGFHFTGKYTTTQDNIQSSAGIRLETTGKAVEAFISHCWAFYANPAVHVDSYEGVVVHYCNFVAVSIGVLFTATGDEPQINVENNHINAYLHCIQFTNAVQSIITGNLLYLRNDAVANGTGMTLVNCDNSRIADNIFVNTSAYDFNTIVLDGTSQDNFIGTNIFRSATTAIWLRSNTLKNKISRQTFGTVTTKILDQGTNNIRASASALVRKTATQSVANATNTIVTFDAEVHDDAGWHDNATNNSRLTVPPSVDRVVVSAGVVWAANNTGSRRVRILKNGAPMFGCPAQQQNAVSNSYINISSGVLDVSSGDYFEVQVYQDSGGALNVLSAGETWFAIQAVE